MCICSKFGFRKHSTTDCRIDKSCGCSHTVSPPSQHNSDISSILLALLTSLLAERLRLVGRHHSGVQDCGTVGRYRSRTHHTLHDPAHDNLWGERKGRSCGWNSRLDSEWCAPTAWQRSGAGSRRVGWDIR